MDENLHEPAHQPVAPIKTPPPVADGPVPPAPTTLEQWATLVAAFESHDLPWTGWRHPQHLAVSAWYVWHEGLEATARELPGRIRAFNASHGVETTKERGYHETMTRFWLALIADLWALSAPAEAPLARLERITTVLDDKHLPFAYYSRDRLMSWEARREWVAPDLKPLGVAVPETGI